MTRYTRHIVLPFTLPLLFFAVAFSPVEVLGCLQRGLLALLVSLISGFSAVGTAILGTKARIRGDSNSHWWMMGTLVLPIPVVAMLVLA